MWPLTRRAVAVLALLLVLVGLCVAYGSLTPDPASNRLPSNEAFAGGHLDPADRVVLAGTVRSVDDGGVIVALDGGSRAVVDGVDGAPAPGDDVWLYGVVRADGSVESRRAVVRAPWEVTYLYAVSTLGAVLTLGRAVRTWRFDRDRRRFVPREGPDG